MMKKMLSKISLDCPYKKSIFPHLWSGSVWGECGFDAKVKSSLIGGLYVYVEAEAVGGGGGG